MVHIPQPKVSCTLNILHTRIPPTVLCAQEGSVKTRTNVWLTKLSTSAETPLNFVFEVGFFAAAFVPTFLVSRIFFRLSKRWEGHWQRLALANLAAGIVCVAIFLISGMWFADGLDFPWLFGLVNFALAQAIWLAVDLYSDWINNRLTNHDSQA